MQEDRGLFEEDPGQGGAAPPRLPPTKRKRLLEEELDQYLEDMDQLARQEEETRITSLLGIDELRTMKQEPAELGRRPKVLRKSIDDVKIWTTSARRAEWESYPNPQTENTTTQVTDHSRVQDGIPWTDNSKSIHVGGHHTSGWLNSSWSTQQTLTGMCLAVDPFN
jgi:hypothetical protein